jgi:hypothetical protein
MTSRAGDNVFFGSFRPLPDSFPGRPRGKSGESSQRPPASLRVVAVAQANSQNQPVRGVTPGSGGDHSRDSPSIRKQI